MRNSNTILTLTLNEELISGEQIVVAIMDYSPKKVIFESKSNHMKLNEASGAILKEIKSEILREEGSHHLVSVENVNQRVIDDKCEHIVSFKLEKNDARKESLEYETVRTYSDTGGQMTDEEIQEFSRQWNKMWDPSIDDGRFSFANMTNIVSKTESVPKNSTLRVPKDSIYAQERWLGGGRKDISEPGIVREFRITMPMTMAEYQIGQLFATAEASKNETGGGEGVEVIRNESYERVSLPMGPDYGQYTQKVYHLDSKVPAWVRAVTPKDLYTLHEECWNSYPYNETHVSNLYMEDDFFIVVKSLVISGDRGHQNNVHNLPANLLQKREVVQIDIAKEVPSNYYRQEYDPRIFKSSQTGRGPLVDPNWKDKAEPVMTCYKLVLAKFKWFGLQTKVESTIMDGMEIAFCYLNRQIFCTIDKWHGMTLEDIRRFEEKTKDELEKNIRTTKLRGNKLEE